MHDPSPIFIIMAIFFGIAMVKRGRGFGRYQERLEREIAELRHAQAEPRRPALRGPTMDQVQALEDRVRVLERIVTDSSYNLASEIEKLRDDKEKA